MDYALLHRVTKSWCHLDPTTCPKTSSAQQQRISNGGDDRAEVDICQPPISVPQRSVSPMETRWRFKLELALPFQNQVDLLFHSTTMPSEKSMFYKPTVTVHTSATPRQWWTFGIASMLGLGVYELNAMVFRRALMRGNRLALWSFPWVALTTTWHAFKWPFWYLHRQQNCVDRDGPNADGAMTVRCGDDDAVQQAITQLANHGPSIHG